MIIGFVGTGTITAALVRGMHEGPGQPPEVILSPRSVAVAERLARAYAGVSIASDNQAVVDAADLVVLAVRPQVAAEIVAELQFRPGQKVVSLIATFSHKRLRQLVGDTMLVRAIPLPFAERRMSATAIFPSDPEVSALFARVGQSVEVEDECQFDALLAASALMGTYFGTLETVAGWLQGRGVAPTVARAYLDALHQGLAQTLLASGDRDLASLRHEFSTRGGINEQLFREYEMAGGTKALLAALESVRERIEGGLERPDRSMRE